MFFNSIKTNNTLICERYLICVDQNCKSFISLEFFFLRYFFGVYISKAMLIQLFGLVIKLNANKLGLAVSLFLIFRFFLYYSYKLLNRVWEKKFGRESISNIDITHKQLKS